MNESQTILVVYHKDCVDGTAAAAVALRKFPEARLYPLSHSASEAEFAPILEADPSSTIIYTVDCAIGITVFLEAGFQVVTIDHHIGIKDELDELAKRFDRFILCFSNEHSGATLTWSYLFPDTPIPHLLALVEDGDLWQWQFGDETKYAHTFLSLFRNDPTKMLELIFGPMSDVLSKGEIMSQYVDSQIAEQLRMPLLTLRIGSEQVIAANVTIHESSVGNALAAAHGQAIALFTIKGDVVRFSFRSTPPQRPTALDLATRLGGGGHVHTAGAQVTLSDFIQMLV